MNDENTTNENAITREKLQRILLRLDEVKTRATYAAVGELVNISPMKVGELLGDRQPLASWIVARRNHLPTGYNTDEMHTDLFLNRRVIDSGSALASLVRI